MVLSVSSTPGAITAAVNSFSSSYHADYFAVKGLARAYLASAPSVATASPLAGALSRVLTRWGAGKRGAPSCQPVAAITHALSSATFHRKLVDLEASISFLAISGGRRALNHGSPFASVSAFDDCLIDTINSTSAALLIGNTNVTYPMKSLLLLTGLIPAFDSQVRGGLAVAGLSGVKKTRYLLPKKGSADAQKICALPFYISECISRLSPAINSAISASSYPALAGEHGRIFDVLLFVQNGLTPRTAVVTFTSPPSGTPWYAI
ncbi:hypothetical protein [Metapseudomonas resinovorans]|uniref:hypothetical protein n=1 Tax=Metapseudomonas resinovorans TaxID=53412 RepID=UPI00131C3514|nr:hypothetical protein [Pseudomonas resinovorans]